jgi:O-antigen/teichoic acid export membrane protein
MAYGVQASLVFNGGLDPIAIKEISANKLKIETITSSILLFRLTIAFLMLTALITFAFIFIEDVRIRTAWMAGGILMLVNSANISFAFQGASKFITQAFSSLVSASIGFVGAMIFFREDMPMGSDIVLAIFSATAGLIYSLYIFHRLKNQRSSYAIREYLKLLLENLQLLLKSSWMYWVISIIVFIYSSSQILVVGYFFGDKEAGHYRSAIIFSSGLYLIFNSANVFLIPKLTEWSNISSKNIWDKQIRLAKIQFYVGLPIIVIAIILAPYVYREYMGLDFIGGIQIFQILAFDNLIVFIGQIFYWGLTARGDHIQVMRSTLLGSIGFVFFAIVLGPLFGTIGIAIASVISNIIIHLYAYYITSKNHK